MASTYRLTHVMMETSLMAMDAALPARSSSATHVQVERSHSLIPALTNAVMAMLLSVLILSTATTETKSTETVAPQAARSRQASLAQAVLQ
jgi:hypothetical protein